MRNYKIIRNYDVKYVRNETPKVVERALIAALGAADACKHFEDQFKGTAEIVRMDIIPEDGPVELNLYPTKIRVRELRPAHDATDGRYES